MCGVWDRRPSNAVGVGAVEARAAEPLSSLLESFADYIASVEKVVQWRRGGVASVGEASPHWQRPSLDRVRVRMPVG
jgi:hypothetical protein